MKKIYLLISIVLFTFMLFADTVRANEAATSATIKYDLAFPGILPDNPFYKLKVIRDRISIRLISDVNKKIEFYLLQADKGIFATAMLVDKNKIKLANETALKAENNMTLLTFRLKELSKKPNSGLFKKLITASLKHQEVLTTLANRVSPDNRDTLIKVINFSKTNLQTIEKLQSKKYYIQQ